jgi:hypothetical protein
MTCFEMVSELPGETEENHENPLSGKPGSRKRLKPGTPETRDDQHKDIIRRVKIQIFKHYSQDVGVYN